MSSHSRLLVSSLLLAGSVLTGAAVSVLFAHSAWLVMLGPAVIAAAIVWVEVLGHRRKESTRSSVWATGILAGSTLVAGAVVAISDPGNVASLVPILGACAAMPLISRGRCCASPQTEAG